MWKKINLFNRVCLVLCGFMGIWGCSGNPPMFKKQSSTANIKSELLSPTQSLPEGEKSISSTSSDKKARRIGELSSIKPASPIQKPAVKSLMAEAREKMGKGQMNEAFATAERGIAIDSSDALLWNLMAEIRLKQDNYAQAEQLAKKSNLLTKDRSIQAKNWRLISEALRGKGSNAEAKKALFKALELETERTGG